MGGTGVEAYTRKLIVLILLTNLLTIYILLAPTQLASYSQYHKLPLWDQDLSSATANANATATTTLLQILNETRAQLARSHSEAAELRRKLTSTNLLVQALLIELTKINESNKPTTTSDHGLSVRLSDILVEPGVAPEVRLAVGPHKLPTRSGFGSESDKVYPSFGAGCLNHKEELIKYLSYEVGRDCPVDDMLAQKLMLKGCEPLPRRRCRPRNPSGYKGHTSFPKIQWATPPNTKWVVDKGLDYDIDQVLATWPANTVRIGLDIGDGTGTFAAKMRGKNITIITTTTDHQSDHSLSRLMASRGLVPLHVSISQRLPFSDNTLDIVHSMHVLSNRVPSAMLEFTLYDIYRVIRPGGLFWLDKFSCQGDHQLNDTYIPMIKRVGFQKIRLDVGQKLDRGSHKDEWYLSALLEKPIS